MTGCGVGEVGWGVQWVGVCMGGGPWRSLPSHPPSPRPPAQNPLPTGLPPLPPTCAMEPPGCPALPPPRRAGPPQGLPRAPTAFAIGPPGPPRHPPPLSPRPARCPPDKPRYLGVASPGPPAASVNAKPFDPPGAAGTGESGGGDGGNRGRLFTLPRGLLGPPAPNPLTAPYRRHAPSPTAPICRDTAPSERRSPGYPRRESVLPGVGQPRLCRDIDRGVLDRSPHPETGRGGKTEKRRWERRGAAVGTRGPAWRGAFPGSEPVRRPSEAAAKSHPGLTGQHRRQQPALRPHGRARGSGTGQHRQLPAREAAPRGSRFPAPGLPVPGRTDPALRTPVRAGPGASPAPFPPVEHPPLLHTFPPSRARRG